MGRKSTITLAIILAIGTAWAFTWRSSTAQDQAVVAQSNNENVEVLARGPVHEAFAEPVNLQHFDPLLVELAPPDPVEELPPDQKPEGENVEWIPGYWAWDDDRKNFLWVSGVWRDVPPGQRWVPGYWSQAEGGWCWTAGFWVSDSAAVIEYLPEPPETLEVGPQIAAPSQDHVWVPGIWHYQQARYVWRPGYWTVIQPGWVWVPARYIWCPSGYVFVDGYWDYPIEERGVLFAPVFYHEPIYRHATYYYTPTVVISTEILTVHLFARPRYCHYYFGDYYAPRYREIGIEPWLMFPRNRGCYDPLYHYYGWHHRRHGRGDWHRHLHDRYEFFAEHEHYRPAHTYAGLRRQRFDRVRTGDINIDNSIQNIVINQNNLAVNFNQYVENVDQDVRIDGVRGESRRRKRFARVDNEERRQFAARARDIRGFQVRRSEVESQTRITDRADRSDRGDRGQVARGDRGEVGRGDRGARRSLSLADLQDHRGNRAGGEPRDRRAGRARDRASVAADVPPTPEQTARATAGPTNAGRDATAGADRNDRRSRSFERPGRQDITQQPDATRDVTRDAIGRRDRARAGDITRSAPGQPNLIPGQNADGEALGQDARARDRQRGREDIRRRGGERENEVGLGRVGRDGPQFPGPPNQHSDRTMTTRTPPGATMPRATTPGGRPVTDSRGAGTTTNQQLDALGRGRGSRGDRTRRLGDIDAANPNNNAGGLPAARQRGRGSLRGTQQNPPSEVRPDATGRTFPEGLSGNEAVRNRQLRGRGDENRSQNDPFRQRGLDRDAFRSPGQLGGDAAERNLQSQRQDAYRRQLEQQRGNDEPNRSNNLELLLNQQREAARQRGAGSHARAPSRQQFDRGRSGFDFSRGRGNEQSPFGDAGERDSQPGRGSFGPFPGQQSEHQSFDRGQPGGRIPSFDPRSQMQRGSEGRSDNDMRRQFSPGARPAFGGRGGGGDGAEALQRMNRGGRGEDASQRFNRGGRGQSISQQQDEQPQSTGRAERRERSGGEDQRGERGGRRDRDRDDDD